MQYLVMDEDGLSKQFSEKNERDIEEELLQQVDEGMSSLFRFNVEAGKFERALITSDTTSEDDKDEVTTYEIASWIVVDQL